MVFRAKQRGSAALEAALVILPMFAILLAVIDFSVAIFIRNSLMNAVREGVRFGITGRTLPGLAHDGSIKEIVRQYSMGFLNPENLDQVTIRYFDPITSQFAEGQGSNRGGNILEVRIDNYPWLWMAPVLRSNSGLTFSVQSSDLMEPQPNGPPNR
jgi:cytochrome c-type biogenesis protein CcmE